jgi:hypothetical protein
VSKKNGCARKLRIGKNKQQPDQSDSTDSL